MFSARARASRPLLVATLALGCDQAEPAPEPADASVAVDVSADAHADGHASAAGYTVKAEDLDLEATVALIQRADVRDAASVEALLNADDSPIQLDVDADGQRDFVSVHEDVTRRTKASNTDAELAAGSAVDIVVKDGSTARFELLVVPSSTIVTPNSDVAVELAADATTVLVATVDFEVDVKAEAVIVTASYAPVVIIVEDSHVEPVYIHKVHIDDHHDDHIVVGAPFVAWIWLGARPVYIGHHHLPHGHAKHMGLAWHHGPKHHDEGHGGHHDVHYEIHIDDHHGKHGKHKGSHGKYKYKSKGKGKGHGKFK